MKSTIRDDLAGEDRKRGRVSVSAEDRAAAVAILSDETLADYLAEKIQYHRERSGGFPLSREDEFAIAKSQVVGEWIRRRMQLLLFAHLEESRAKEGEGE